MLASPFERGHDERAPVPMITLTPRNTGDQRESGANWKAQRITKLVGIYLMLRGVGRFGAEPAVCTAAHPKPEAYGWEEGKKDQIGI
jgi:hypothetical protein